MNEYLIRKSVKHFLAEDIGNGDITSEAIFSAEQTGEAVFVAKDSFIAAGMKKVAGLVFQIRNPEIEISNTTVDATEVSPGDILLKIKGPVLDILEAERVALNLVRRLCGIATLTSRFVKQVATLPVRIVDTRKTTPGLRALEKYAVRVGGGYNHRFNLSDGILIKDNHIAACGSITEAVRFVRENIHHCLKIEVETEKLEQVKECLECGVEIIMLDNMEIPVMKEAVSQVAGKAVIEASGGINLDNIKAVAETGIDIISIGAITHSAPSCDISMRLVNAYKPPCRPDH
ncbi:MAG: carboxylating nicotinate-nucleotide diphosphorylase [Thermodesulfobacteriota bacterium]|nr:carboxylating nicotinate-nucleotide diphosphorylase [Thermodesulfobacteriota bacterium]